MTVSNGRGSAEGDSLAGEVDEVGGPLERHRGAAGAGADVGVVGSGHSRRSAAAKKEVSEQGDAAE